MKKIFTLLAFLFLISIFNTNTKAQPGVNDPTFNPIDKGLGYGDGFNGNVFSTKVQTDGKILVAGGFFLFNGIPINRIARLNTDSSLDTLFNSGAGFNYDIFAMAIQPDGKIIVGGEFTSFNGNTRNRIARLNTDGTLDLSFNTGAGFNNDVHSISIQNDGKIIIAGTFTIYKGITRNRMARLNSNGSLDQTFDPGIGSNMGITTTAIQPDGKIMVGGGFTDYGGTWRNRIARVNTDGTLDFSFTPGAGFSSNVTSIVIQPDGKLIVGGGFTDFNGIPRNGIARLNPDGFLDNSFNPGTGFNGGPTDMLLQNDGKIIAAGGFISYNGTNCEGIARINTGGSLDTIFTIGTGFSNYPWTVSMQSDGKIIVGGNFSAFNGRARKRIARLNSDGSLDGIFNPGTGFNTIVRTIAIQNDDKIVVGGFFTSFNDVGRFYIARLNPDGLIDSSFNPGMEFNNVVWSVASQSDGKVLVGEENSIFSGTALTRIVRLNTNGTVDTTFNIGTGFYLGNYSKIATIAVQSDGKILAGGHFAYFNGIARSRIARLKEDGSLDTTFNIGAGFNSEVKSIAVQSDGKILVGGHFTSFDQSARNRIVRLNTDGSVDTTFNSGNGFDNFVLSIAIQSDGKIIVGGRFKTYNGIARMRIARMNADGTLDASFDPGTGCNLDVHSIAIQNGKIILSGEFTTFNGAATNHIARLNSNGTLDTLFDTGTGFNGPVYAVAFQSDDKIIVGGHFTSINNIGRNRIARLLEDSITTTGVKKINLNNSPKIYPNPNTGNFIIETSINTTIDIFNTLGQLILSKTLNAGTNNIGLEKVGNGMYFISSVDEKGNRVTQRVVVE